MKGLGQMHVKMMQKRPIFVSKKMEREMRMTMSLKMEIMSMTMSLKFGSLWRTATLDWKISVKTFM